MTSELTALITALKAAGVKSYKGPCGEHPVDLEFFPSDRMVAPEAPRDPLTVPFKPEVCRCGHLTAEHTDGLCLMACDEELCIGEPQQTEEAAQ